MLLLWSAWGAQSMKIKFNKFGWIVVYYSCADHIYGMVTDKKFFDTKKEALAYYKKYKDYCWFDQSNLV
jgi:hypothetical protein